MKLLENWLPPDGSGDPIGCLATSFTFDGDFFSTECLARFLQLSGAYGEGDQVSDVALMLEEEERLSETSVVVLADRNCRPEARNLRWDLVPVTVQGALLHAKVALLIWDRAMRMIIGSANLTAAGYRRQLETVVAFDIDDQTSLPRSFVEAALAELRDMVMNHAYGDPSRPGPKNRAIRLLDIAAERAGRLPNRPRGNLRVALAPARTGLNPLRVRNDIWRGPRPHRVVALSPFWDEGTGALPGAEAVLAELGRRGRHGAAPEATFVVFAEALPGGIVIRAPERLSSIASGRVITEVRAVAEQDRRLHAKALLYEGTESVALMIGSSNLTAKGLGLAARSHREVNVWFAASPGSPEAKRLGAFVPLGEAVDASGSWEVGDDEDELALAPLPEGFLDALLTLQDQRPVLQLAFDSARLPARWSVTTPAGSIVIDSEGWHTEGTPRTFTWPADDPFPSALDVTWSSTAGEASATWPVNIGDPGLLPPPAELRGLPVSVLLSILASTRPIHVALETELRRQQSTGTDDELDPLRRFDSSGQLLHRIRRASAALWGLQQRLKKPATDIDALEWRFTGVIGPRAIAEGLMAEVTGDNLRAAEAAFILAELALTVARVRWDEVAPRLEQSKVRWLVECALEDIAKQARSLDLQVGTEIDGLALYVEQALKEAKTQWSGT